MFLYTILFSAFIVFASAYENFINEYSWKYINYTWPSYDAYLAAKNDGSYIPKNNVISSIAFTSDKIFLTIPRWKNGVPVTLAMISTSSSNDTSPLLQPYPNWQMQKIGDCNAFQNVKSLAIDPKKRLWILDSGKVNECPPRLVILDLENEGEVLGSHVFPAEVVNPNVNRLSGMVLEYNVFTEKDESFVYITDADVKDPGLVVYSFVKNSSWKVRDDSMFGEDEAVGFHVGKGIFSEMVNVYGVALMKSKSEGGESEILFSPLTSYKVYKISTKVLKNENMNENVKDHIKILGRKLSQSSSMVISSSGKLYYGMLADDGISVWDSQGLVPFKYGQRIIARDHELMQWPGYLTLDVNSGKLWVVSNRLHQFFDGELNLEETNFRLMSLIVENPKL